MGELKFKGIMVVSFLGANCDTIFSVLNNEMHPFVVEMTKIGYIDTFIAVDLTVST